MGFFKWEERFSFGYGTQNEYDQLKKKEGSYLDIYELTKFEAIANDWDILIDVHRVPHRKKFVIPLSELQTKDTASPNYQLLNDYTVWLINWQ